jgi:hypothetical protein
MLRKVIEWTPGRWWAVEVSGRDGSYTPLYEGKSKRDAERWLIDNPGGN